LEEGETANPYAYEDEYKTLEKCQRFYETGTVTVTSITPSGNISPSAFKTVQLKRTKRNTPDISLTLLESTGSVQDIAPNAVDSRKFAVQLGTATGGVSRAKLKWIADSELPLYNNERVWKNEIFENTTAICSEETARRVAQQCNTSESNSYRTTINVENGAIQIAVLSESPANTDAAPPQVFGSYGESFAERIPNCCESVIEDFTNTPLEFPREENNPDFDADYRNRGFWSLTNQCGYLGTRIFCTTTVYTETYYADSPRRREENDYSDTYSAKKGYGPWETPPGWVPDERCEGEDVMDRRYGSRTEINYFRNCYDVIERGFNEIWTTRTICVDARVYCRIETIDYYGNGCNCPRSVGCDCEENPASPPPPSEPPPSNTTN
jgi:hypothetical protein